MDLETQNYIIPLLEGIAADAYKAQADINDPDSLRVCLSRITEAMEEIQQRLPAVDTSLDRAKRLMPWWRHVPVYTYEPGGKW